MKLPKEAPLEPLKLLKFLGYTLLATVSILVAVDVMLRLLGI